MSVVRPSMIAGAQPLLYPAPVVAQAPRQHAAYELDYGPGCDTLELPMPPCGAASCLLCPPINYTAFAPLDGQKRAASLPWLVALLALAVLTLAVLLSWRYIVNFCVKRIEQWRGLPAVRKRIGDEEKGKCCSFWFVPADFVLELAKAIGEAPGPGERSSSGSNSGGNRHSELLAQYLDASTPTTTLSRCFVRLRQVREAMSSHPTTNWRCCWRHASAAQVQPADGSAPKLQRQKTSAKLRRKFKRLFPSLDFKKPITAAECRLAATMAAVHARIVPRLQAARCSSAKRGTS